MADHEIDVTRMPDSIDEIRGLLTTDQDRERFAAELEAAPLHRVRSIVEDWGMYAIGLHDEAWQRYLALRSEGRSYEGPTITTEELFAMRGQDCPSHLRTPTMAERGLPE